MFTTYNVKNINKIRSIKQIIPAKKVNMGVLVNNKLNIK